MNKFCLLLKTQEYLQEHIFSKVLKIFDSENLPVKPVIFKKIGRNGVIVFNKNF